MENYYKYHCGDCGTEWTKDNGTEVQEIINQKFEYKIGELEKELTRVKNIYDEAEANEWKNVVKEDIDQDIIDAQNALDQFVEAGVTDTADNYMNGSSCPKCGSDKISGQEQEQ